MSPLAIEILIILALVAINGGFAMAEIAIVSARKARLEQLANAGNHDAGVALNLARSPRDFLSTVQVGITLVGVLAGAYGGATVAEELEKRFLEFPLLQPYAETLGVAIVVLFITYLSLILGELAPKRIALNAPERIGLIVARPMQRLSRATSPLVRFLSLSTDAVLWLLRIKRVPELPVTEEEVRILIRQGASAGVFEEAELRMIDNVFRLGSRSVNAIMTPRNAVVALYTTDSSDILVEKIRESGHSAFPLCEGNLDNVIGVVHVRDLLLQSLSGHPLDPLSVAKAVPSVPESSHALKTLEMLRTMDKQMVLAIDEFGGLQGIVTIGDFAHEVVGAGPGVSTPGFTRRSDGSLLVDGMLPLDGLKDEVRLPEFTGSSSRPFSTLGGFVLAQLGRIPKAGDWFVVSRYRFEVVDMDGVRVDKVLIIHLRDETP